MKIKTQFVFLSALIIAVPVLCTIFIPCYDYFHSSDRVLVDGYKTIRQISDSKLSKEAQQILISNIKLLPPDVQSIVVDKSFHIIANTIPELIDVEKDFKNENNLPESEKHKLRTDFMTFMEKTSNEYFYQFTTLKVPDSSELFIISRIPRNKNEYLQKGRRKTFSRLVLFIIILVSICVLLVILISRTIFKSISLLENQTKKIASGDLDVKVDTSKKTQNEITSITDSLEKMRLSLIDAKTRRNKFIMGISHDLRTPIAVIKGYTEAISDGIISEEEIPHTLDMISVKTGQLGSMINTLINFVKLDSNEWYQNLKNENISELITGFAHDAEITGELFKRKVTCLIDLPEDIFIPMDSQLVTRVFENLLSNAIRYSKDEDSIHISAFKNNGNITFEISDTGCGMSEEDVNHIFDLFYRGTSSRREEGMGIGLSVVKTIIETMNWKINVSSKLGEGSVFTITIPVSAS